VRLGVRRASTVFAAAAIALSIAAWLWVAPVRRMVDAAVGAFTASDPGQAIEALRTWLLGFGAWAPIVSAGVMILQAVVAPLPAFVVTFANGLLFGWAWGAALSWSSAMVGAALCFWIAQALGRPAVERLLGGAAPLDAADRFFLRHGRPAILTARLLPFVPFDAVSYGAGLTSTGFRPFLVATGLGQLPATLLYSWLGQSATSTVRYVLWFAGIAVLLAAGGWALVPRIRGRPGGDLPASGGRTP
jgi:uncharacterized membrane protein YdjX (TVP38/TMEM64 family)